MQRTSGRLRRRRRELDHQGGFTLIEVLIVIVILAILAAIVVLAVQTLTINSAKSACGADYKTVESAVESYKGQMGGYPNGGDAANGRTTDTDPTTPATNAAAAGGELLTGSQIGISGKDVNNNITANADSLTGSPVGPWLKDVPANGGHYTISVANDGTGGITVTPNAAAGNAPCSAVS